MRCMLPSSIPSTTQVGGLAAGVACHTWLGWACLQAAPGVRLCCLVRQTPQSLLAFIAYLAALSSLAVVGRAGASVGAAHSLVPPPARRVPAKHRHLLPLLRQLIGEHKGRQLC